MNLQDKMVQLQTQLAEWEAQSPRNQSKIDAINAEIARVQEQLRETETREQKTGELLDEYNVTLNNIFDAILPESVFAEIFGINEYNEKRSDFKKCMAAYHGQKIATINADHMGEIEVWRDKFGNLTAQVQDMVSQMEESNKMTAAWQSNVVELEGKLEVAEKKQKSLEQIIEDQSDYNNRLKLANDDLRGKMAEMQTKLEQASKPRESVPNEALDKVLEEVKSRKQMNSDELMRRFNARMENGGKVMSIEHGKIALLELPYTQTAEVAAPVVGQSATIPVVESQFPSEGDQPSGVPVPSDGTDSGVAESFVTRAEFETLKARVVVLESNQAIGGTFKAS